MEKPMSTEKERRARYKLKISPPYTRAGGISANAIDCNQD